MPKSQMRPEGFVNMYRESAASAAVDSLSANGGCSRKWSWSKSVFTRLITSLVDDEEYGDFSRGWQQSLAWGAHAADLTLSRWHNWPSWSRRSSAMKA